jgi:hypothetical protein
LWLLSQKSSPPTSETTSEIKMILPAPSMRLSHECLVYFRKGDRLVLEVASTSQDRNTMLALHPVENMLLRDRLPSASATWLIYKH